MDKMAEIFLNWQVLLISFATFAVVRLLRALGTQRDPKTKEVTGGWAEHYWFRRFLPIYPYAISFALCFLPGVPMPEVVVTGKTLAIKILYAIYTGWLSEKIYQIVKRFLEEKGVKIGDDAEDEQ